MDSSTYRHLIGQLKKSCQIPHHNFPCHNLLSMECLLEVSKDFNEPFSEYEFPGSFPCYKPFPYVVQQSGAFYSGSGATDEAKELVKKKLSWENKLKSLKVANINQAVKSLKSMKKNKLVRLSENLKKYIEHFQDDPEPAFSGSYNWLYTGGCLSCDGCVLSCVDFISNKPGFNLLKLNESLNEIQCKTFTKLKSKLPVLQITCKSRKESLIICVRQKNTISLFSTDTCLLESVRLWRKRVPEPKLLTCSDVKANLEEVVTIDSNHDLNVFCIETKSKCFSHSGKMLAHQSRGDAWNQVSFGYFGIYWGFRNGFVIFDDRDPCFKTVPDFTPSSATNLCENICSFIESPTDPNSIYLGTSHNILQVDLRQKKSIQRWTHLMKSPPQFMTTARGENRSEVLVLQSQSVDEVCGIVNERREGNGKFISKSLSCLLGSVRDSFRLAQLHGLCLNPSVSKRVDFCVTGLTCLKTSENDLTLFTSNSGGDIFVSKITKKPRESQDVEETLRMMSDFDCEKPKQEFPTDHLRRVDMSHVVSALHHSEIKTKKRKKQEICWKAHEMYSPESLMVCKDVLAPKILKVWGHQHEKSDHEDTDMSVNDKVREWMNRW